MSKKAAFITIVCIAALGCGGWQAKKFIDQKNLVDGTDAFLKSYDEKVATHYKDLKFDKITDNRDGHRYSTVKIGDQVWMAENMRYDIAKGSVCFNGKSENCQKFGNLYSWNDAQKSCPSGWHLSTDKDWNILEEYIKDSDSLKTTLDNQSITIRDLLTKREAGRSQDTCKITQESSKQEIAFTCDKFSAGLDWFGFGAILSGDETCLLGKCSSQEKEISFWTSTETDKSAAVSRKLSYDSELVQRNSNTMKTSLFAVRCVQNDAKTESIEKVQEAGNATEDAEAQTGKSKVQAGKKSLEKAIANLEPAIDSL